MVFNSMSFLIFFPIVALLYFAFPKKIRYVWLLMASYYFYMCWNARYAVLILISTVSTYVCGLIIGKIKNSEGIANERLKRKLTVAAGLVINLGILFGYKYLNFLLSGVSKICELVNIELVTPSFDILLPVGISFYTFQVIGISY